MICSVRCDRLIARADSSHYWYDDRSPLQSDYQHYISAVGAPIEILGLSNGVRSGLTGFVTGIALPSAQTVRHNMSIDSLLPNEFYTDRLRATLQVIAEANGRSFEQAFQEQRAQNPIEICTPDCTCDVKGACGDKFVFQTEEPSFSGTHPSLSLHERVSHSGHASSK